MNRNTRKKQRLLRLCRKYGYYQTASILKRQVERVRLAQMADDTPILYNLTQREDAPR